MLESTILNVNASTHPLQTKEVQGSPVLSIMLLDVIAIAKIAKDIYKD